MRASIADKPSIIYDRYTKRNETKPRGGQLVMKRICKVKAVTGFKAVIVHRNHALGISKVAVLLILRENKPVIRRTTNAVLHGSCYKSIRRTLVESKLK